MKNINEDALAITEKLSDPIFQLGGLSVLGITVPTSLEEVGAFGLAVTGAKFFTGLRDRQFVNSFERFAQELNHLTLEQKQKFYDKYSDKTVEEFGEQVLLLLNKIEMPLAAKMLGKAHYLLVLDEIDEQKYSNYCHIIKNLNFYLFKQIDDIYSKNTIYDFSGGVFSLLSSYGVFEEVPKGIYPSDTQNPTYYRKSEFGQDFYQNIIQPFSATE